MTKRLLMLLVLLCWAVLSTNAQTSPHGKIKIACEQCHTTDSWKMRSDPSFDHATTGFALEGSHKTATCVSCHKDLTFPRQSQLCSSCHVDVHKSELGANCTRCHSLQSWKITDMLQRHQSTRFPLLGRHSSLDCRDCHSNASSNQFTGAPTTCYGCHRTDFDNSRNPNHAFAGFSTDCSKCHKVNAAQWSGGFDHNFTGFPLSGAHQSVSCASCHKNQVFKNTAQECYACHQSDYQLTTSPNHALAKFATACQTCHTTLVWKPSTFSHDNTKFPLTGSHRSVQCADCHTGGQFAGLPSACFTCHQTDYSKTTSPNHVTGLLNHQCESCHTTTTWQPSTFSHGTTKFPLTGKHLATPCESCHTNGNYQLAYTNCVQCHAADFQGAANPNHVAGSFSQNCATCHSTAAWQPASFDHGTTKFALTGAHLSVACQSCHTNGNYQLVYSSCYQCHAADFQRTKNPNHVTGNFSQSCQTCHTTTAWAPAAFDHTTTKFALTGAHVATPCASCHTNNNYQLVYTNCYQCHASDFQGATNPNHVTGLLNHQCESCHTTTAWQPSTFSHGTTKFPLTGKHLATPCELCHTSGNYQLAYTNCGQCHAADFQGAKNPNHVAGNFSQSCQTCHTTTAWQPASFDHNTTKFQLTGKHLTTACESCHTNGNYQLVFTNCYQCHAGDFQGATSPNHVAGNFSQNCATCHTTTAWQPATFDHNTTKFALTGAHISVACQSCHTNGNYQLVYSNCYQCHATDFQGTKNPNHVTGNFSQSCQTCHTTTAWTPASFDHSTTKFALTGAHVATPCASCHTNNNYQLVYTNCYQCHASDFQGATNPNHVAGNFSQTCQTCHSTTAWRPATFNHSTTKFPLTGVHITTACQSCHTNGNYTLAYSGCYTCHTSDYNNTTNPNHRTSGYPTACETCHTTTTWTGATFNHTWFPTSHGNARGVCASCHTNPSNYKVFQCTTCHTQAQMDPKHSRVSGYVFNSQNCYTCHPRGSN